MKVSAWLAQPVRESRPGFGFFRAGTARGNCAALIELSWSEFLDRSKAGVSADVRGLLCNGRPITVVREQAC